MLRHPARPYDERFMYYGSRTLCCAPALSLG